MLIELWELTLLWRRLQLACSRETVWGLPGKKCPRKKQYEDHLGPKNKGKIMIKVQDQPCRNHNRDPIFRCSLYGDSWGGVGESVRLPFRVNQMNLLLLFLGSLIMHGSPPNILTQMLILTRTLISWKQNILLNMAFAMGPMSIMKQLKYLFVWSEPGPWEDRHLVAQRWKHEQGVRWLFFLVLKWCRWWRESIANKFDKLHINS